MTLASRSPAKSRLARRRAGVHSRHKLERTRLAQMGPGSPPAFAGVARETWDAMVFANGLGIAGGLHYGEGVAVLVVVVVLLLRGRVA
jgi:hypothetical protein